MSGAFSGVPGFGSPATFVPGDPYGPVAPPAPMEPGYVTVSVTAAFLAISLPSAYVAVTPSGASAARLAISAT